MPQTSAAKKPVATTVQIHGRLQKAHDRSRIFGAAETLLCQYLEKRSLHGHFTLHAIDAVAGSRHVGNIRVRPRRGMDCCVMIQPGSQDTAWEYRVILPKGVTVEQMMAAELTPESAEAPPSANLNDVASPVVELHPEPAASADFEPEPAPTPAPAASTEPDSRKFVRTYVHDLERVALVLAPFFPAQTSTPAWADLVEAFRTEFLPFHQDEWPVSPTQLGNQAVQALINHNRLKAIQKPEYKVLELCCDNLKGVLVTLGMVTLRERSVLPATPTPAPAAPAPVVERRLAPRRAPVPPNPPSPHAATEGSVSVDIAELERKATAFVKAQTEVSTSQTARDAVLERRARATEALERAQQELAQTETELARIEAERTDALTIMADPVYSGAAAKMAVIRNFLSQ